MATAHTTMVVVTGGCRMAALTQAHATGSNGSSNTISAATASIVSRGRSLRVRVRMRFAKEVERRIKNLVSRPKQDQRKKAGSRESCGTYKLDV